MAKKLIRGQLVDLWERSIYPVELCIDGGVVASIERVEHVEGCYILPGFVDAHIHIESSMLVPTEFAKLAVCHGTVGTVSDPHEIANVLGVFGVEFMIENAEQSPLKFCFGVPSCVPASVFETAGARIGPEEVEYLFAKWNLHYLAEVMNYPGVLDGEVELMQKIAIAKDYEKPIDGHAPGLAGDDALRYIAAGIGTDHECFSYEEAKWKADHGMKILIREGSAAKNFDALIGLMDYCPELLMFCSDDKHPDELMVGHINQLVARAVDMGFDLFDVLRCACVHPVEHYGLDIGLLRVGDSADFIISPDLRRFENLEVYIDGVCVAKDGRALFATQRSKAYNNFEANKLSIEDLRLRPSGTKMQLIKVLDGALITDRMVVDICSDTDNVQSDTDRDILKLVVLNRYESGVRPSIAFISGFGLKQGAIASTVAHDSHNVIAVGADDESLLLAINSVVEARGGIVATDGQQVLGLDLPVAGLMSLDSGVEVGSQYERLDRYVKSVLGSNLSAPFMSLSFMALLVIPSLKLSDRGLFDGRVFEFVDLFLSKK